jgi:long-subunit acyl-CoA synthetase (AMP-forming)
VLSANPILAAIEAHARRAPDSVALIGNGYALNYAELQRTLQQAGEYLQASGTTTVALALDNSPAWAVLDLGAMQAGVPLVPLPLFFSDAQVLHAIRDAGADRIITDQPQRYQPLLKAAGIAIAEITPIEVHGQALTQFRLQGIAPARLSPLTAKITYTSGTTGQPKGVCLSAEALYRVSASLLAASGAQAADRHLSVLPLSTLLENIGGVYVPLMAGACSTLLPLADVGLHGASGLDVARMLAALSESRASSTILTPELLQGLVMLLEAGQPADLRLRFIAVGGASVAPRLLQRAQDLGLPVFEGYGLSECASVVALNTAHDYQLGSVGKPLPHVQLRFAADGEIEVAGATLLGYSGGEATHQLGDYWPTGDIGHLDRAGFLHITGRKKNMFITSFGRNVMPEWVERELTLHPAIAQAAVFGEGRPWNVAVIVARGPREAVEQAIAEANRLLPDYAQVRRWIPAQAPFTPQNGQLTPNARLRREAILNVHGAAIDALYEEQFDAVL